MVLTVPTHEIKTPNRFMVNLPIPESPPGLSFALKPAIFDNVPTDLPPLQEAVIEKASGIVAGMVGHDRSNEARLRYLNSSPRFGINQETYRRLARGDEEKTQQGMKEDVEELNKAISSPDGEVLLTTSRDAWIKGDDQRRRPNFTITAKTDTTGKPCYEMAISPNSDGGSNLNLTLSPTFSWVVISDNGSLKITNHGQAVEPSEDVLKQVDSLLGTTISSFSSTSP